MKRDWWNKEFRTLVTMGESTTAGGWSSCRERCWASLLAAQINELQRLPVQFVNVGIGANVISTNSPVYPYSGKPAADERLEKHVLSNTANGAPIVPDLLVISYGLNDARGGTPLELFDRELRKVISRVRDKIQPLIVLLGPYYMNDFELGGPYFDKGTLATFREYNAAIQRIANETDCLFVDLLDAYGEADWLVHGDGVHANDLGHRVVANRVFEALAQNCSGLSLETKTLEQHILPWRDELVLHRESK